MGQSSSHSRPTGLHSKKVPSPKHSSSLRPQSPTSVSTSPTSPGPHKSLRTKKKSLELPDLASLGFSPTGAQQGPYSRHSPNEHYTSSPIPIPVSPIPLPNPYAEPVPGRKREHFVSTQQMPDMLTEASTHIPIYPVNDSNRRGGNPFPRGGPLRTSTHSFANHLNQAPSYMEEPLRSPSRSPSRSRSQSPDSFVPQIVVSTLPIGLFKLEQELHQVELGNEDKEQDEDQGHDLAFQKEIAARASKEPVPTKIYWKGGGRKVLLARAADDNWKGRLAMEPDQPPATKIWSCTIPLLPGTHHIKFVVDDMWRVAESLPTAVDEEGSLSNYIVVGMSGSAPHPVSPPPKSLHHKVHQTSGLSFWSTGTDINETSALTRSKPGSRRKKAKVPRWTDELPPGLIEAKGQEEDYLAEQSALDAQNALAARNARAASAEDSQLEIDAPVPIFPTAPNIPDCPLLPPHLGTLILNAKRGEPQSGNQATKWEKEKGKRRDGKHPKSLLGMTPITTTTSPTDDTPADKIPNGTGAADGIPVATPNGTDVGASVKTPAKKTSIDLQGIADDASVLPVPSHVVLHHLNTTTGKDKMVGLANSMRYKDKYLTTIYYKQW